jgi:hypothetical protein
MKTETKTERAKIIEEFNQTFGWNFPTESSRETLSVIKCNAELRGRKDIAGKIEKLLQ